MQNQCLLQIIKYFKNLFKLLTILFLFTFKSYATEVTWAGVAFVSDQNPAKLYPNLSQIGYKKLNAWAFKSLKKNGKIREFNNFKIRADKDGNPIYVGINESQGVLMSVIFFADDTFFGKNISALGRKSYDNSFQIYGALVFFEFETGSYINSVPFILDRTFGESDIPSNIETIDKFANMLNSDNDGNFFDQLFERSRNVKLNALPEKFAKFGEVKFGKTVKDFFARTNEIDAWKLRINKQYENLFSLNTQIPMVPSGPNSEIDAFKVVFNNAAQTIELPKPFFVFNADVKVFKKIVKPNKENTFKTVCHFVGLRLYFKIQEDDGPDDIIMNIPFVRTNDSCGNIGINNVVNSDYYFPMNMLALISNSAKQFKSIDNNYLKKVVMGKNISEAINEINEVKAEFNN